MATGLAVANNPSNPEITEEIAQWAIDYVAYHGSRFFELVESNVADNEVHRLRNQILKAIHNAGIEGRSYGEMHRYCRMWKGATLQQRDSAIESLKREGLVVEVRPKEKSGRGKKATLPILYHMDHFEIGGESSD